MLFYRAEVAWLPKQYKATYSTKQLVYRLDQILAVVICIDLLTVCATKVLRLYGAGSQ